MPRKKSKKSREDQRDDLASDVDAFLANGGEIETVDFTANRGWRNRNKPGQQHIPLRVTKPKRHRWATGDYSDM